MFPDPATLTDGWLSEGNSRFQWPSVYIHDIADHLKKTACSDTDILKRLLNEYKEGKAYRYYSCEWVREVKYHPIRSAVSCCFLTAHVHPSMNIRQKAWKVWVLLTKKTATCAGGDIRSAHCTCPAGLLGSCNHIAGLLFRVEAAVKCGATELSATEEECSWVVPRGGVIRKPGKWRDSFCVKDRYGQKTSRQTKEDGQRKRLQFKPFPEELKQKIEDPGNTAKELESLFIDEAPSSVFMLMRKKRKPPAPAKPQLPENVISIATKCSTAQDLLRALSVTPEEVDAVESATRDQSHSCQWAEQRQGRITSSIFYNVYTKSKTLQKNSNADESSWLTDKIIGRSKIPKTHAMKHGLALEPKAKAAYSKIMRACHKKWSYKDSGLLISLSHPIFSH